MALTKVSRGLLSTGIVDNSNATAITIDSSENVGIGTSSPNANLHISSAGNATNPALQFGGTTTYRLAMYTDSEGGYIENKNGDDGLIFRVKTVGEAMRIAGGSGKISMGTSSADTNASVLTLKGADPSHNYDGQLIIHGSATSGAANTGAGIGFKGHHGTGNRNLGAIQSLKENGTSGNIDTYMRFVTRSNSSGLVEAMRITSAGRLGIGQSSPATALDVNGGLHGDHATFSSVAGRGLKISTESRGGQNDGTGVLDAQDTEGTKGVLSLQCGGAEKLRVEDARVMVGKSDAALTTTGIALATTGTATFSFDLTSENESFILNNNNSTGTTYKMDFRQNNSSKGQIVVGSSSTAYNTSSDYRLKENVTELTGATARLKQLTPKRFNFIAEPDITVDGFLAHEVSSIVPEAINGEKDAVDDNGNPQYQGIDQSKLVPLLVATIQELEARITALEAE